MLQRARWAAWVLLAAALLPFASRLDRIDSIVAPNGSQSWRAMRQISSDFAANEIVEAGVGATAPSASPLILVMRGIPSAPSEDSARGIVRGLLQPLSQSGAVRTLLSPASNIDTLLWSRDRRSAIAIIALRGGARAALDTLRAAAAEIVSRTPGLTLRFTGESALLRDLKAIAAASLRRSEMRAMPITLLAAWWAFGSLIEALVAIGVSILVVATALGVTGVLSLVAPASPMSASLVSLTGLALSIDYQLIVRRCASMGTTLAEARRLVRWSSLLVCSALLVLAMLPIGDVRNAALACAAAAAIAALGACLRDAAPGVVFVRRDAAESASGSAAEVVSRDGSRWSTVIARRPLVSSAIALLILGTLAWPVRHIRLGSPVDALLPRSVESMRALDDLDLMGRGALPATLTVLVTVPRGTSVLDASGWNTLEGAVRAIRALPRVARVDAITTIGTGDRVVAQFALPESVRNDWISRSRQTSKLLVIPRATSREHLLDDAATLADEISQLLQRDSQIAHVLVGGLPVMVRDVAESLQAALPVVVIGTFLISALVLMLRFRAPLLALKAITANTLVVLAAMGCVVRLFQSEFGAAWMPFGTFSAIFPSVPLLVFTVTFGISMDYELLLLTAFERRSHNSGLRTVDAPAEVAAAMIDVAGLIWRAAALSIAVCGAFMLSELAPMAMVGLALSSAILLDATVVRLVLVPAWLSIAGDWNWWPGKRARAASSARETTVASSEHASNVTRSP